MQSQPDNIDEKGWRSLTFLKKHEIFLRITADSKYDQTISFYHTPFARLEDEEEIEQYVKWLVQGDIYFATQIDKRDHSIHDLRDLEIPERNAVLEIIQKMSLDQNVGFRLSISPIDSRDFYDVDSPRNVAAINKFLPARTSYLNLFVRGSVHTKYIPAIIRSLHHLKHVVVSVYARHPFPDCGTPQDGYDSDEDPAYYLEPGAWCTRNAYCVHTDNKLEGQMSWNLQLRKGERPCWVEVEYHKGGKRSPVEEMFEEEIQMKNGPLVRELNEWFKLSGSLKAIDFRVFAASPWEFKYMSEE
jgi:hypothetical protein